MTHKPLTSWCQSSSVLSHISLLCILLHWYTSQFLFFKETRQFYLSLLYLLSHCLKGSFCLGCSLSHMGKIISLRKHKLPQEIEVFFSVLPYYLPHPSIIDFQLLFMLFYKCLNIPYNCLALTIWWETSCYLFIYLESHKNYELHFSRGKTLENVSSLTYNFRKCKIFLKPMNRSQIKRPCMTWTDYFQFLNYAL